LWRVFDNVVNDVDQKYQGSLDDSKPEDKKGEGVEDQSGLRSCAVSATKPRTGSFRSKVWEDAKSKEEKKAKAGQAFAEKSTTRSNK
jgi:hypothetical protein